MMRLGSSALWSASVFRGIFGDGCGSQLERHAWCFAATAIWVKCCIAIRCSRTHGAQASFVEPAHTMAVAGVVMNFGIRDVLEQPQLCHAAAVQYAAPAVNFSFLSVFAAPAFVTEYLDSAFAVRCPVLVRAVYVALGPVVECLSPAPVVSFASPALQCVLHQPLSWSVILLSAAPVSALKFVIAAPAKSTVSASVVECIDPAPAVGYAASAFVVIAASAPVAEYISPAPAVSYTTPVPTVSAAPAPVWSVVVRRRQ